MSKKLNVPNILGLSTGETAPGILVFLQSVQDALNVIDDNVVYRDALRTAAPTPTIRQLTAQGQTYSVSGTDVASGVDYQNLVQNFRALLDSHLKLSDAFSALLEELKGK